MSSPYPKQSQILTASYYLKESFSYTCKNLKEAHINQKMKIPKKHVYFFLIPLFILTYDTLILVQVNRNTLEINIASK